MPRFRKKPIVVRADLCNEKTVIHTLEGDMVAERGDWIITGVKGECYPCKHDIFVATYEPADDAAWAYWREILRLFKS